MEGPTEISLAPAIDDAFQRNYDSRVAFEHVYQAKNSALAAWLNLLPHITANLIWHAPMPTYVSTIATLQGLTPFVLPTFYMDARCASYNTKVQRDALLSLQADLASNLEQLFYSYERDSKLLEVHQKVLNLLDGLETQLREKNPEPFQPEIQALLDLKYTLRETAQTTLTGLERVLIEDRYALSRALGKHNPEAITKVSVGNESVPIEWAEPLTKLD